ncbi:sigma-70 family RNA polymerase sigma factor [Leptobacterium flavescens]|uniref:Sigma-70 family RNA polymerase sigma factor n=1 Tax=Leptobacterium flavescens TaxID=472055 RepID=A0A6P0UMC8_9FLAO|nr:RNA polymerase sigma factor [Leptobacterium flavescens]NER14384.1 sigma-70 family RNA polymerase sigma factor [Leptobacterium flavescens]
MNKPIDKPEFLRTLKAHEKILFKVCNLYCRNPEDRKDLMQEIIIQLWTSFHRYDSKYRLSTWMYRVSLNVAISYYRKTKRHADNHFSSLSHLIEVFDTEDNEHLEENTRLLYRFIRELNDLNRALIMLYLDDYSYKEIAEIMGITVTNVSTKINRIKKQLKQKFEQMEKSI